VGDVTCAPTLAKEPCIVVGASHIKLSLNGFTITGPVDPITNTAACGTIADFVSGAIGIGIEAVGQNDIEIEGPGLIRHFVNWGIFLGNQTFASTGMAPEVRHLTVRRVTVAFNCWSGLQTLGVTNSRFEDSVFANNAVGSNGAACGGICMTGSSKNRCQRNTLNGNGAATPGSSLGANNFGIGLEGTSNDNHIEENEMGGNVNGVLVYATASGNVIRHNIIAGNPPAQVSVSFPAPTSAGADIHDRHAAGGANTFEENFCLTYIGPGTAPCPNIQLNQNHEGDDQGHQQDDQ
jgi:parallel beta-helix repeat protein